MMTDTTNKPVIAKFPFDQSTFEVEINVSTNPDKEKLVAARLRKPTLEEEYKRHDKSQTEIIDRGEGEEYISQMEEADAALFDAIVLEVKGFRKREEPREMATQWRDPEGVKQLIPSNWKMLFVRGTASGEAVFVEGDDDDVILGDDLTIPVDFFFPSKDNPEYTVHFEVPTPTERERIKFQDEVVRFVVGKGRRKASKVITSLKAAVTFFDQLMNRPGAAILDGTVQGKEFFEMTGLARNVFLEAIDPAIKSKVVNAAMSKFNARLRD